MIRKLTKDSNRLIENPKNKDESAGYMLNFVEKNIYSNIQDIKDEIEKKKSH